jgi:hypothetical protein
MGGTIFIKKPEGLDLVDYMSGGQKTHNFADYDY